MRTLMLLVILVTATYASTAAAEEPATSAAPAESTPSPTSPSTDAPAEDASANRTPVTAPKAAKLEEDEFKVPSSYKPRLRGDETVYCRKQGESGTRFNKTECYTLAELKYKVESEKAAADDITRRARVCSSAGVCSGN